MDIQDIIFNQDIPVARRQDFIAMIDALEITDPYTRVLVPTESNNDVNGSQHVLNGGTDFTYEDASESDVLHASTAGTYEYFSGYRGMYTGHYYEGDRQYFSAVVIDPPEYAATYTF